MKKQIVMSLALATLLMGALGCKKSEEAMGADVQSPQTATTSEIAGTSNPNDLNPIRAQAYIDDVKIGHELGADGIIAVERIGDNFAPGRPIHLTMTVNDAPADAAVKVVWYGPNDTKINEEQKKVPAGATTLGFAAPDTSKWGLGDYRAEVWVGDEKVDTENFNLVDQANVTTK